MRKTEHAAYLLGEAGHQQALPTAVGAVATPISSGTVGDSAHRSARRALLIQLEFPTWAQARSWSYATGLGIEEGLRASGLELVTLPAMCGRTPSDATSWIRYAGALCAGKSFDQVWMEIVHTELDEEFLDWVSSLAPVRIGFMGESLTYSPEAFAINPLLQTRQSRVEKWMKYFTHVLAFDEKDADDINARGLSRALWWPAAVPQRCIRTETLEPPKGYATFYGALYGERLSWLNRPDLRGLLFRPASHEDDTRHPRTFDDLNRTVDEILAAGGASEDVLHNHMEALRNLRMEMFELWLDGLAEGIAVVNLPHLVSCYAGRVVEAMAAGRPVISWEVPDRPRNRALFEDGEEILLFPKDHPSRLAEQIRQVQGDPALARQLTENARRKVQLLHTVEKRVEQVLHWVETGEHPPYDAPTEGRPASEAARKATVTTTSTATPTHAETDEFYLNLFGKDPYWSIPYPNPDEAARWGKIMAFLSQVAMAKNNGGAAHMRILDLGCGRGWMTNLASVYGKCEGVDPVGGVVEIARRRFPNLRFYVGGLQTVLGQQDFAPYEVVLTSEVIEHVPRDQQRLFVQDLRRTLRPGGFVILTTPRGEAWDEWRRYSNPNQPVEDWLRETEVEQLFTAEGFRCVGMDRVSVEIPSLAFVPRLTPGRREPDKLLPIYQVWAFQLVEERQTISPISAATGEANATTQGAGSGPLVSVIVPTHSRPEMLREALASIVGQTYENFEIVVVNDAGDDVRQLLQELPPPIRVKYLTHARNRGLAAARNTGIGAATGTLIAYLDDDDVFYPNHLSTLVKCFTDDSTVLAYTDGYCAHQDQDDTAPTGYVTVKRELVYHDEFNRDELLVRNYIPVCCIMHRKWMVDKVGLFDEQLFAHEDHDLWLRASRLFDFKHVSAVTCEYRQRGDGSNMTASKLKDFFQAIARIYHKRRFLVAGRPDILARQEAELRRFYVRYMSSVGRDAYIQDMQAEIAKIDLASVSVIIPVHNNWSLTRQCIEGILQTQADHSVEVLAIDNASTDETPQGLDQLVRRHPQIRVLSNDRNESFARASNQGARAAQGKYLLFLNNDTVPHPGWLDALLSAAQNDPSCGAFGSRLLYPDGTIQHAGIVFVNGFPQHIHRGQPREYPAAMESRDYPAVTGACLLIAKDLFLRLGGFDEDYPMYVEDVDLCLRVWEAGLRVSYCTDSVLTHYEGASNRSTAERDANVMAGMRYFHDKWAARWPKALQQLGVPAASRDMLRSQKGLPVLWHGPIYDPSGYADEARHFVLNLREQGVKVAAGAIGRHSDTFRGQLDRPTQRALDAALADRVTPGFISVIHFPAYAFRRLPEASYQVGRVMYETDGLPADWVAKCNQMDEIWVPTDFNLETFKAAGVTARLFKVPGGIDPEEFKPGLEPLPIAGVRGTVFLSVFEWLYRKGWDVLLRAWAKTFAPTEDVTLVLRTYPANVTDAPNVQEEIERRINLFLQDGLGLSRDQVAPIVVLGDQIPERDMPRLFAAAHAYVGPSRGEGWGRPQMQAMACGLPVLATRWSGNLEFMNDRNSLLIDVEGLVTIDERAEYASYRGQRWAEPSVDHLATLLRRVVQEPEEMARVGRQARRDIEERWDWKRVAAIAAERLWAISTELASIQPALLPSQGKPLAIRWEGAQFVHHSLALVNRELCIQLIDAGQELSIIPSQPDQFSPAVDPRFSKLAARLRAALSHPADVHLRHQWPPSFTPPSEGHWVMIQPWEFGSIPTEWIERMKAQVDEVWVPTSWVRQCYVDSGLPADRVQVVPNGVDTTRFRPDAAPLKLGTQKRFKFLFVGGTIRRKGPDVLLEAYVNSFTNRDDVCLVIKDMGGKSFYRGQTAEETIRAIQAQPNAPEILYLTEDMADADLPGLYTACDCLVHPYRGEGFGLPIAEAMACGLPVVVTGAGACLDFCDETNSYLIPAQKICGGKKEVSGRETADFPYIYEPNGEATARLMRHVFDNQDEARGVGARASQRIREQFTWQHAAQRATERILALRERPIVRFQSPRRGRVATIVTIHRSASQGLWPSLAPSTTVAMAISAEQSAIPTKQGFALPEGWTLEENGLSPLRRLNQLLQDPTDGPALLLSADVTVTQGWLEAMLSVFDRDPNAAVVGPASNRAPKPQRVTAKVNGAAKELRRFAERRAKQHAGQAKEVGYLGGFCLVFDRRLCRQVGLLREDLEFPMALWEYFGRLRRAGHKLAVAQAAYVHHERLDPEEGAQFDDLAATEEAMDRVLAQGETALQQGDPQEAVVAFTRAAEEFPELAAGHAGLATALMALDRVDEAVPALRRAVDLAPNAASLQNQLGVALYRQGDLEGAEAAFSRARAADPQGLQALLNLVDLYHAQERYVEATQFLKEAMTVDPNHPEVLVALATLSLELGDLEAAEMAVARAKTVEPEHPDLPMLEQAMAGLKQEELV